MLASLHVVQPQPTYYSYRRWSTPPQSTGDSYRRQIEKARARAVELGAIFDDTYHDPGVSAFRGKHIKKGALGRLLAAARSGDIAPGSILGFENQDRFGRQEVLDAFPIFAEVINLGITLDINGQLYTRAILRKNPYLVMGAVSEMIRSNSESFRKSEMIAESNAAKRQRVRQGNGIFGGGRCPVWLKPKPDRSGYLVVVKYKTIVVWIFLMANSGLGSPTICKILNDPGERTMPDGTVVTGKISSFDRRKDDKRPAEPNGWHPSYVNLLLRNRQVIGECQFYRYVEDEETGERKRVRDGDPMPDHFPAIIDKDLFDRVQRAVADRRITGAGRKGEGFPNLITGFGLCVCGGHLYYDKKGGTAKLRCERHRRGLCPHEKGYPYKVFEQQLLSLTGVGLGRIKDSLLPRKAPVRNPIPDLEAEIAQKEASLARLVERFRKNTNPSVIATVEAEIDKVGAEIEADKARLQRLRAEGRADEFGDDGHFFARLQEAHSRLTNGAPDELYLARAKFSQELRSRMAVILYPDRRIELKIRNVVIHLVPDREPMFAQLPGA